MLKHWLAGFVVWGLLAWAWPATGPHRAWGAVGSETSATKAAVIGPGDRLQVAVNQLMMPGYDYVLESTVDEMGDIKLMVMGRVHVGGLTAAEAQEKIGKLAVEGKYVGAKSATDPGPEALVRILKKAEAGSEGSTGARWKAEVADTLQVSVYELTVPGQMYAAEVQVDEDGKIKLRNLGRLAVGGLTVREIEDKIAEEAVKAGFLLPKGPNSLGPQVIVSMARKAAAGEKPTTLRAGDRLQVEVFELVVPRQLYAETVTVDEGGSVKIAKVGAVRVAGMMPWQVEEKIAELAVAGGYLPGKETGHSAPLVNVTWLKAEAGTAPGVVPAP